ncbi:DUF6199 family natural product biosynthesis protein [Neobacillus sp. D3-1R]|uniref:DUF6199 family natural product biosynthesis protein n=1 Tax=Neobacillus sp. D3-1R TaxID=3445778 RepID=UPI003FA097A4
MLIGIILLIIGVFVAIKPYLAWYLYIGWQIKDSEPTTIALSIYRIIAILTIISGIIVIIKGSFSN